MESSQDDDSEKPHEPTEQKLLEARRKGEVVRSQDVTTAAAYGGFLLAGLVIGAGSITAAGGAMMSLIEQAHRLADQMFTGHGPAALKGAVGTICLAVSAWLLVPAGLSLLSVLAQRSFVVAGEKLHPKISRISIIQNAKKKFGPSGLFEFFKSFLKLVIFSASLGVYLSLRMDDTITALFSDPALIGALMMRMLAEFMVVVLAVSALIGALDYLWQRYDFLRQNRMSQQEVKEEHKRSEGDPHLKQERQQRGHRIASAQMLAEIPKADVVIMNPTHFAVALKWSRAPGAAPVCVAKGVDHLALAIRDCARENKVPVRHDAPTARALHASTEIGREIDPRHYRSVAAAIRFSETMRRRARSFG